MSEAHRLYQKKFIKQIFGEYLHVPLIFLRLTGSLHQAVVLSICLSVQEDPVPTTVFTDLGIKVLVLSNMVDKGILEKVGKGYSLNWHQLSVYTEDLLTDDEADEEADEEEAYEQQEHKCAVHGCRSTKIIKVEEFPENMRDNIELVKKVKAAGDGFCDLHLIYYVWKTVMQHRRHKSQNVIGVGENKVRLRGLASARMSESTFGQDWHQALMLAYRNPQLLDSDWFTLDWFLQRGNASKLLRNIQSGSYDWMKKELL